MNKRIIFICILGTLLFITVLFELCGFFYLRSKGYAVRFTPLTEEQMGGVQREIDWRYLNKKGFLYKAIQDQGIEKLQGKEQIVATLEFIMNSVTKVTRCPPVGADELYRRAVAEGEGCLCGGMAVLFHHALLLQGIPARQVAIRRAL